MILMAQLASLAKEGRIGYWSEVLMIAKKLPVLQKADNELLKDAKMPEIAKEMVNHPSHYGGKDNPTEAIKVVEAWNLGFNLGNTVKYISRAGKKDGKTLQDLKKAMWYLNREIENMEKSCQQNANSQAK